MCKYIIETTVTIDKAHSSDSAKSVTRLVYWWYGTVDPCFYLLLTAFLFALPMILVGILYIHHQKYWPGGCGFHIAHIEHFYLSNFV